MDDDLEFLWFSQIAFRCILKIQNLFTLHFFSISIFYLYRFIHSFAHSLIRSFSNSPCHQFVSPEQLPRHQLNLSLPSYHPDYLPFYLYKIIIIIMLMSMLQNPLFLRRKIPYLLKAGFKNMAMIGCLVNGKTIIFSL